MHEINKPNSVSKPLDPSRELLEDADLVNLDGISIVFNSNKDMKTFLTSSQNQWNPKRKVTQKLNSHKAAKTAETTRVLGRQKLESATTHLEGRVLKGIQPKKRSGH